MTPTPHEPEKWGKASRSDGPPLSPDDSAISCPPPQKSHRRPPPLSQTSHVSVPPIARGPPFSIPPHFLRVEGRDPSFRLSPEPDHDAPSAEHFRLPALLCDFRLRRNSPTSRPQSFGTSPAKPSATPRLRNFDALRRRISSALPPPTCPATYAPNLPCPVPGENLCNSPPAARPSTPFAIRCPIRREAADPRRPRPAAKIPGPRNEISPDTRKNPPGAALLCSAPSQQQKSASLPIGKNAPQKSGIRPGGRRPSRTIARPSARSRSPRRNAWRRACAQTVRPASSPDAPRLRGSRRASSPPQNACP